MPRGPAPNRGRRQQIIRLRESGLSLGQIGKRLGISRQAIHSLLKSTGNIRRIPVCCQECGEEITTVRGATNNNRAVWCLACLSKHPKATFGQRLKTHRLSAGLTLEALAQRSGIGRSMLGTYECDRSEPRWRTLARLIRALGVGLVDIEKGA